MDYSNYSHASLSDFLCCPYTGSLKEKIVKAQINVKRYKRLFLVATQVDNPLIAPIVY